MPTKTKNSGNWLQATAVRVARVHFIYISFYALAIIMFDSWNLITHEMVSWRWTAAGILAIVNTVVWYLARMKLNNETYYRLLILVIVVADIIFAAINVFWQRGVASKAVMMFGVPIITVAGLRSRSSLFATAALSASAYSIAAVRYFNQHYGESFRVELWGEIIFYSAVMFVLAFLLLIIIRPKKETF